MKLYIKLSILAIAVVALGIQLSYAKPPRGPQGGGRTVYYVVMGSYNTLEAAKASLRDVPDGFETPIYEAKANGRTVYRHCISCSYSKGKAQADARFVKDHYLRDAWVWPSRGLAKCVYCPIGLSGDRVKPLRPR